MPRTTPPDRVETVPAEEPTVVVSRVFDVPRETLWAASLDLGRWWGPHGFTTDVLDLDARPGGTWRVVQRAPDGSEHAFWGECLEVVPPERVVQTQRYLDFPPILVTVTYDEAGPGRTRLTAEMRLDSVASRDAFLASGALWGMRQSHDRLAALAAEMLAATP